MSVFPCRCESCAVMLGTVGWLRFGFNKCKSFTVQKILEQKDTSANSWFNNLYKFCMHFS